MCAKKWVTRALHIQPKVGDASPTFGAFWNRNKKCRPLLVSSTVQSIKPTSHPWGGRGGRVLGRPLERTINQRAHHAAINYHKSNRRMVPIICSERMECDPTHGPCEPSIYRHEAKPKHGGHRRDLQLGWQIQINSSQFKLNSFLPSHPPAESHSCQSNQG